MRRTNESKVKFVLFFLLIFMIAAGFLGLWFAADWTKNKTISGIQKHALQHLELYKIYITSKIAAFSNYPVILAENSMIISFCDNPTTAPGINSYLSQFNASVGASVSYIINKNGIVIASSNWDADDSFIGKDYSFRPYYKSAISGIPSNYVAIGVTSKKPGYYASYPVRKDSEVIGVAVVKSKLDSLELGTQEIMGTLLIADENNIIFESNDDMFNFYSMQKLSEGVLSEVKARKQYEGVDLKPLPIIRETTQGSAKIVILSPSLTDQREVSLVMEGVQLQENGWNVYLLLEVEELDKKILINMTIVFAVIVVMFVTVFLLINARLRNIKENFIKHQKELETKVDERTSELHEINEKLLFELVERKRLENALKIKTDELETINENLRELVQKEVSEHNKKEQILIQQSRMAAMGEMIGVIAHQWRQPLNAIGLIVQDLVDAYKFGEMNEEYITTEVQTTMQHIGFMSQTIDDFRNFLKPSKKIQQFDVNKAIEEIISMFEGVLRRDSVVMSIENPGGYYLTTGYPNEFKQVILNIINNAKDAIVSCRKKGLLDKDIQGKITITLENGTTDTQSQDKKVTIYIRDNGGGIPEDVIDRIFAPYFTTKSEDVGTGIGLYMSKTIIENNMGGRLTVRNISGGAEFTIEI
ncbi:MAG: ATP-binding protein [Nitrospirota bacterium]